MKARHGWYLAGTSRQLRSGRVLAAAPPGRACVLARSADGGVHAFSAYCPHMGTHLRGASVARDRIRCPLHGWEFGMDGRCETAADAVLPRVAVREGFGGLFVHAGQPVSPFPAFEEGLRFSPGTEVVLRAPWRAVVANGFDVAHLTTVHRRTLVGEPEARAVGDGTFVLAYTSRVTGSGLPDVVTRLVSGDRLRVRLTAWGGSLVTVATEAGRHRAALLVAILPEGEATRVRLFVGARRPGPAAWLARFLYSRFLARDVAILDDIDFAPRFTERDAVLRSFLDFLGELPEVEDRPRKGSVTTSPGARGASEPPTSKK